MIINRLKNLLSDLFSGKLFSLTYIAQKLLANGFYEDKKVLFASAFNRKSLLGWSVEKTAPHSINFATDPVRTGKYSIRCELRRDDKPIHGGKRAEISLPHVPPISEQWYAFSVFLPSTFAQDSGYVNIAQWHGHVDSNIETVTPSLFLRVENDSWTLHRRWDPNPVTVNDTPGKGGGIQDDRLCKYQTEVWTDWLFHVKWSWHDDGLLEVWKNGEKVFSHNGPTAYNDPIGPCFKMGVYKPHFTEQTNPNVESIAAFFDRVKVAGSPAKYQDLTA